MSSVWVVGGTGEDDDTLTVFASADIARASGFPDAQEVVVTTEPLPTRTVFGWIAEWHFAEHRSDEYRLPTYEATGPEVLTSLDENYAKPVYDWRCEWAEWHSAFADDPDTARAHLEKALVPITRKLRGLIAERKRSIAYEKRCTEPCVCPTHGLLGKVPPRKSGQVGLALHGIACNRCDGLVYGPDGPTGSRIQVNFVVEPLRKMGRL